MCGGMCSQARAGKQHGTYLHRGCGLRPCGGGEGGAAALQRRLRPGDLAIALCLNCTSPSCRNP